MECVNDGTPFVSVVEYGKETFVNIRQICGGSENVMQQGVLLTMKQFSLLMYHLKAIETSLVEVRKESVKKDANEFLSTLFSNSTCSDNVDYSRTDKTILTNVDMYDQSDNAKRCEEMEAATNHIPDVIENNNGGYEVKLTSQCDQKDSTTYMLEPKLPTQRKRAIKFPTIKTVREELMQIYCELFQDQFSDMIVKKCMGCFLNSSQRDEHDVCKLMLRKERIEVCFYDIVNMWSDEILREKLTKRMWNAALPYNEDKMYILKDELLQNVKWVQKLKCMIERC